MERSLETALVGLKVGWGRASGNHQHGASMCARLMASHIWHPSDGSVTLWQGAGGLRKGTMASASTFVWEKAAPQLSL